LRALSFFIQTNLLIALAAVALTLAAQVQLGMQPQAHAYLAVIFFATLLDYNLHRFIAVNNKRETLNSEKFKWASEHQILMRILIIISSAGLVIALFFVRNKILYLLGLLAILTVLYSIIVSRKQKSSFRFPGITGTKTLLLAFVWTCATVFLPVLQSGHTIDPVHILITFAERFTFIFAIAIPFDIRDMKPDSTAGIKTIPVALGRRRAMQICNTVMVLSLVIAIIHYWFLNMIFIIPACLLSIGCAIVFINSKKLQNLTFYYHGILDGSILLYGVLIWLSFYFMK